MTTDALIIKGDCLNVMAGLPDGSIDAIVTDPPYGLGFLGKNWDHSVPGEAFWREALRVAKPGCHLLAAGGSRTYHRLACAIEDAGWEIRDCIMWLYGSGFPKSLDVSKAIDREAGAVREKRWKAVTANRSVGTLEPRPWLDEARKNGGCFVDGDAPATDAARQWSGWGTALKPAFEPFILARKPLDGTVANNVQRHGCGGLNVDGCRVKKPSGDSSGWALSGSKAATNRSMSGPNYARLPKPDASGRWPANVIHDGSDEVMAGFEGTEKYNRPGKGPRIKQSAHSTSQHLSGLDTAKTVCFDDSGSAARFFYCAKASRDDRSDGNHHPTVKPIDLMKYLCRLITPPGGLILDPFCGSGSTGVAAIREGFNFIGIELNAEYAEIARRRIGHENQKLGLFN